MKKTLFLCLLATVFALAGENLLRNSAFQKFDDHGIPIDWFKDGKTVIEAKDGAVTLSLAPDHGSQVQATLMQHIVESVEEGHSYRLTARISAPQETSAMFYVEGDYYLAGKSKKWITDNFRTKVPPHGTTREIIFAVPAKMWRLYVSMRTMDANVPVTFSDVKLEEIEGGNLLLNPDFSTLDVMGIPQGWVIDGQTIATVKDGAVTLSLPAEHGDQAQATLMQHLNGRLPEGMACTLLAHVAAPSQTAAQLYIEGEYMENGQTKTMQTDMPRFPVDAQGTQRRIVFSIPGKMKRANLVMRTTDPAVPVTFSHLRLAVGNVPIDKPENQNLLPNYDFTRRDANGALEGWFALGKTATEIKDGGVTLSLSADCGDQKQATLMQHLATVLKPGKRYTLTGHISSPQPTGAMFYVEGVYRDQKTGRDKGFLTENFNFRVDDQGVLRRIQFKVPGEMKRIYIALRTTEACKPVTFRELRLAEQEEDENGRGFWESRAPGSPENGLLLPSGKSSFLRQVPVMPGHTYRLSYNVVGSGNTGSEGYSLYDYSISSKPVLVGGLAFHSATTKETPNSMFITVPATATCTALDLTFASQTCGELKFSNIKFEEGERDATEGWAFLLTEPCYRNTIYERTDTGFVAGEILAAPPATAAKVSIDGLDALTVPLTGGKGKFRVKADKLSVGSYPVTCRVEDAKGQELKFFQLTLRKVPPAEHEVLVDEHQAMLVDGKPFFPVVEYRTGGTGSLKGGFYHRARHGINTVVLTNLTANEKRNLALLDKLAALGMKCVIETWSPRAVTPESQQRFKERFNAIVSPAMRKHPALLAYFTNDEPFACSRNPAPIIWCYNYLKEIDPYHPVWVGQAPRDVSPVNLRPYADGSDITGIDIYPVPVPHPHCDLPDKSLNCLGEYTRLISEVVYNRKPVWMIIQAFAWHDHNFPQDTRRCVYPTEDETRFMAFDAIFNGSRAIVLYGTTTIKSLPYLKLIRSMTEELHDLSGLLARGVAMDDLPSATPKVRMARRAVDGKVYYGIFNQEPQEKTHEFEAERPLIIYREARRLVPQNGKISVKLRPYEVIICGENPLPPSVNSRPLCNPELEDTPDPAMEIIWNKNGIGENIFASQYYRGQANWIWNRDQVHVKSCSCVLYKFFDMKKLPVSAKLLFCADDEADAFLNGQRVGKGDEHGRLHEYDVTKLLKTGTNLLLINARDGGGLPCAMLAELQADGQPLLVTDNSWHARATVSGEDFSAQEQTLPTTLALIVAPVGQGPWKYPRLPDSEME